MFDVEPHVYNQTMTAKRTACSDIVETTTLFHSKHCENLRFILICLSQETTWNLRIEQNGVRLRRVRPTGTSYLSAYGHYKWLHQSMQHKALGLSAKIHSCTFLKHSRWKGKKIRSRVLTFARLVKLSLCAPHWKAGGDQWCGCFHGTRPAWTFAKKKKKWKLGFAVKLTRVFALFHRKWASALLLLFIQRLHFVTNSGVWLLSFNLAPVSFEANKGVTCELPTCESINSVRLPRTWESFTWQCR